jgi:ribonuclease R
VVVRTGRGRARLETVLGRADDIGAVLEGLLVERGARVELEPHSPPEPSLEGRVDLRELTTFTIDPETAKDFDDALSLRREGDGIRAWVHIADVAYFVPAGTPLDRGAAQRGFSTYVPGRVAPMLPPSLSEDLCSLRPHVERLCVTVEIPPSGQASFYRSVIRSDRRYAYGEVEAILAGRERAETAQLGEGLSLAEALTAELRRARFARGALRIETGEIEFTFDGRGGIERAWRQSEPEAHRLVEELMIRANELVASLLAGRKRRALYRVHERPDPQSIALLLAKLADLEVPTPAAPEPDKIGPAEAARLAGAVSELVAGYTARSGRGREAFPALVLRALKQARYDVANLGHMGLASPAYCHFTSPIRRYPDLVVHRALLRELGVSDEPLPDDLEALAGPVSAREREAGEIEYQADEICLAWLLERVLFERGWEETFGGEVIGVIASGLFVRFGEVFEGFLPVRRLRDDWYEPSPLGTALVGRRGRRFRLGDPIEVRVESIEKPLGKVDVSLAEPAARPARTSASTRRSARTRHRS